MAVPNIPNIQKRFSPAVAEAEELAHDQAGKELRKSEVMTGKFAGVLRQQLSGKTAGDAHHHPWRLAGFHPATCNEYVPVALANMRRTSWS